MTSRKSWFGPSKAAIWQQLCEEIDADFIPGGRWSKDNVKVRAYHREWVFTLDTYTVSNGKTSATYTRMRAPYVNWDDFQFRIYRRHLLSGIGKAFGVKDIEVGFPEFDRDFIIQGNDARKLQLFFENPHIRELIGLQPKILLEIRGDEGWFADKYPEGVNELYFQVGGIIRDIDRLLDLYDLFAEVMDHLCEIGTAYEDKPDLMH